MRIELNNEGDFEEVYHIESTVPYFLHQPEASDPSQKRNHLKPGTTQPARSLRVCRSGPSEYRRSTLSLLLQWSQDLNLQSILAKRQPTSPQMYRRGRPRSHGCSRARNRGPLPSSSAPQHLCWQYTGTRLCLPPPTNPSRC